MKANEWGETGRPLLTDEQVEFQKPPEQVQDLQGETGNRFRGIGGIVYASN